MVEKKILQPGPEGKILANYNLTIIISYSLLSMPNDLPIKRVMYQAASKPTDKSGSNVNIRLHLNCRGIALKTAHTKTRLLYRI